MAEDIQYLSDSLMMEKLFASYAPIHKNAGVLTDVLGSAASAVKNMVADAFDTSSPSAFVTSFLKFLEPGILFKINPVLGIIDTVAQSMFGISIVDIMKSIFNALVPYIMEGKQIPAEAINSAGKSLTAAASLDDLAVLEKQGQFFGSRYRYPAGGHTFFPPKSVSWWQRGFGFLGRGKTNNIVVGIAVWLLKTMLLSAGLLAGAGAVVSLFHSKTPEVSPESPETPDRHYDQMASFVTKPEPTTAPASFTMSQPISGLQPSGLGTDRHSGLWIVPVTNGVKQLLANWAIEVYPELEDYEDLIWSTPSFNRTANMLQAYIDRAHPNYLTMPKEITRKIDVVNIFAGDVAKAIEHEKQTDKVP